ncbi:hypothetical protein EXW58_26605 (plasmid) [Bacillus mycoides]|uniref:hypothetical protein n=1 Tax=Bacillus mycoides TaxID=1405 RepID=UPI001C009BF5|nr:hypothetical protein [Bacillus mycoides]QWG31038.1 hypothetical protein EXW58_26605 [Bacillus mycoides]
MLGEKELLYYLINATDYIGNSLEIKNTPGVKDKLIEKGYLEDVDGIKFTEKAIDLLNNFFEKHASRALEVLKMLRLPTHEVSFGEICYWMAMEDQMYCVKYLLKRLNEDGKIQLDKSSNWGTPMKY